jgi:hypothetical protein
VELQRTASCQTADKQRKKGAPQVSNLHWAFTALVFIVPDVSSAG